ncbi:MAG: Bifunctional protein FolC [Candidatus Anoxychlamydiales bacterium]|nr:Bifunctional protein FolC [Candidatus Anoxychlamydiales bacterium]NGX36553.1 Bifunctional protein FolC [Candidatus Anoxychlamydiales bacterium]
MRDYDKLREKLYSLHSDKKKCRLDNILIAREYLKSPDKDFKSIHIAGTNAKSSVALKIATSLSLSGYKTALYTSPHISSYRERIRIDNQMISKKEVTNLLKYLFEISKKLNIYLSFFEITTLLAFLYFSKKKVDFAVIETGLGGRLDATNIINPIMSIITSISLDHTSVLGDTIEKIANEKAQIIKPKSLVIIGPKANLKPILDQAKQNSSLLYKVKAPQKGFDFYDDENTAIAKKAINILKKTYSLKVREIKKALKIRPQARFEILKNLGPKAIVLDVAHNIDGFKELKKAIDLFFPQENVRVILGFSKSKDINSCLKVLKSFAHFIHIVEADNIKALSKKDLKKSLINLNFPKFREEDNVKKAFLLAKDIAMKNQEILLICGSFYILDEIRKSAKINSQRS